MEIDHSVWTGSARRAIPAGAAIVCLTAACGSVADGRSATASSTNAGPGGASSATNSTASAGGANSGASGSGGASAVDDCSAPTITVLAPKQEQITSIALDATNVYWGNQDFDGSRIRTMPKAGGLFTVLATMQYLPANLAVDDTHVYWSEDHGATSMLYSVAKAGGPSAPQQLAVTTDSGCLGLSLDQDHVYWTGDGWIYSIPKSGNASLTELVQPDPGDPYGRRSVIARNDRLYWLESQTRVVSMPKSGGVPTVLAAVAFDSARFAMDDDRIYVGGLGGRRDRGNCSRSPRPEAPSRPSLPTTTGYTRSQRLPLASTGRRCI